MRRRIADAHETKADAIHVIAKKKEVNHITGHARPRPHTGMREATSLRRGVRPSAAPHNIMCPENGDTGADSEPGGRKRHTRRHGGVGGLLASCPAGAPPTTTLTDKE